MVYLPNGMPGSKFVPVCDTQWPLPLGAVPQPLGQALVVSVYTGGVQTSVEPDVCSVAYTVMSPSLNVVDWRLRVIWRLNGGWRTSAACGCASAGSALIDASAFTFVKYWLLAGL